MLTSFASEVLTDIMTGFVEDIKKSQVAKGIRDLGRSADSLRVSVASTDTSIAGQIYGFERFRYQENGRGPNRSGIPSRQMVKDISDWAVRHGMDRAAGWPIAIKIAREGTKVPNPFNPGGVLSEPLNRDRVRALAVPLLREAVLKEMKSQMFSV